MRNEQLETQLDKLAAKIPNEANFKYDSCHKIVSRIITFCCFCRSNSENLKLLRETIDLIRNPKSLQSDDLQMATTKLSAQILELESKE